MPSHRGACSTPPKDAKEQTRKLFEVCQHHAPILTSVNRLDCQGRDLFDLSDEIDQSLSP
jgi:peptide subunit release factor RF-3